MRENKMNYLNVFRNSYKFYHSPIKWIKTSLRNIKYAWQRAVRGYSDYDLFDLNGFYEHLFVESLRDFAKTTKSYPPLINLIKTPEDWEDYINEIAQHFYNSIEDNEVYPNEWRDKYMTEIRFKYTGARMLTEDIADDELFNYYWSKEVDIAKIRKEERTKAFEMLNKVFDHLWS